jgi:chemotaxis protein MotB
MSCRPSVSAFATLRAAAAVAAAATLLLAGCQIVPRSKLAAVESANRLLTEQNRALIAEVENNRAHSRDVEDQLLRLEDDFALLRKRAGLDEQRIVNYEQEREALQQQFAGFRGRGVPEGVRGQIAELAKRFPSLHYDPQTGISKLDTDILFDSGDAEMRPGTPKLLDEFARILNSPEAASLRVMVVGHTDDRLVARRPTREIYPNNWHLSSARALSVADYLRKAGVAEERLGVAGFAGEQPISPNATAEDRQFNRRVEIFVFGPETPVIGRTDSIPSLY